MESKPVMIVDVFHDTACPWCYIGKRHLLEAISRWEGDVMVRYHPFFLNPTIPPEGHEFKSYMRAKIGGGDIEAMFDGPRRAGSAVGIAFNFEAMQHAPNTLDSHRLITFASGEQRLEVIEALYKAYFVNARNIGDRKVLADIAAECGMDRAETVRRLDSDEARAEVQQQAAQAVQLGVTGVPLFVFNNMFALSGAQPAEMMLRAMQQSVALTG